MKFKQEMLSALATAVLGLPALLTGAAATVLTLLYLERDGAECHADDVLCVDQAPWIIWAFPVGLTVLLILLLKMVWRPEDKTGN